jgi:alpha-galactosidase
MEHVAVKSGESATMKDFQSQPIRWWRRAAALLSFALIVSPAAPAPSGPPTSAKTQFAQRPYMGWSSWSFYRDHPTEAAVKAQADALIANGLAALGYRYVNIDDGWSDGFDERGIPRPNTISQPRPRRRWTI